VTRWLAGLCVLLAACDGVGRALVESGPEGGMDDLQCVPIECRPAKFVPLNIAEPRPPDVKCAPPSPEQCEPASETEPGLDHASAGVCRRKLSLDDDQIDLEAIRSLSCGRARLVRTQHGAGAVVQVDGARWTQLDLTVETVDPLTLELSSAWLMQLQLRVSGPVTLRVVEPAVVNDLLLSTDSPAASVDLSNAEVTSVRLGDDQTEFAGTLSIARSKITDANVLARDLVLESVELTRARVTAKNLHWVDVTARQAQLAADTAVISASRLSTFQVVRCGLLSLHRTSLASYAIPACSDGPTRLYEATMDRGNLDGAFDADASSIENSIFGVSDATDLKLWDTSLSRVNFCAGTDHVVIAGQATFECAACRELDGTGVPIDACLQADNELLFLKSCRVLDVAPVCEPEPIRMRPPFN
jgi:hypothetical protein